MAIHFKPILNLSNLILLGLFLLVVQLQNSAVEAGDENLGHRHVRETVCSSTQDNFCENLDCGIIECADSINDADVPHCECRGPFGAKADAKVIGTCQPADASVTAKNPDPTDTDTTITTITPELCLATCKSATDSAAADAAAAGSGTTPLTYTATVCLDATDNDAANCVCLPVDKSATGPAKEQNVDELIETAKAVISGLVNAIIAFVQDLVQALVDLVTALANLPLGDILTGLVGSLKGIVGNIAGADDSK